MSLAPMTTPATWRSFLYENVILPWEMDTVQIRNDAFSKLAIQTALGLYVLRKTRLDDVSAAVSQHKNSSNAILVFYSDGKGYPALFRALRNVAAHGDYSLGRPNWIRLRHEYPARGSTHTRLRLFGHMKFSTLKSLVHYIDMKKSAIIG